MLLPTKHIKTENSLVGVGAEVLAELSRPKTVSTLFHDTQLRRRENGMATIHFDWFLLAVDFLFAVGALRFEAGTLRKLNQ
ncbi:ABC-three component system middle component 6 [Rhizobium bangladeshense]|uniref:ABC-three component system middle component 6 n=1 Tax=Rhizobium bangladeshense TaxID=1138189 RepID=UPI00287F8DC0|nr:ABC-three component system middle component 6 [Rhizobium bangladeshense]